MMKWILRAVLHFLLCHMPEMSHLSRSKSHFSTWQLFISTGVLVLYLKHLCYFQQKEKMIYFWHISLGEGVWFKYKKREWNTRIKKVVEMCSKKKKSVINLQAEVRRCSKYQRKDKTMWWKERDKEQNRKLWKRKYECKIKQ